MKTLTTLFILILSLTSFSQADSTQQSMIDLLNDVRKRPFFYGLSYSPNRSKLTHNDTLAKVAMSQAYEMSIRGICSHAPAGEQSIYLLLHEGMFESIQEGYMNVTECTSKSYFYKNYFEPEVVTKDDLNNCDGGIFSLLNKDKNYNITPHQVHMMNKEYTEVGMGYATDGKFHYLCVILKK